MRLSALILSLVILGVLARPARISDLSGDRVAYFEAQQMLHYDAAIPKVNAGDFESFVSLHFATFIPLVQKARCVVASNEQPSTLPSLPRLHLKLRVFRN